MRSHPTRIVWRAVSPANRRQAVYATGPPHAPRACRPVSSGLPAGQEADQVGGGPPLARPAPGRCRAGRQPRLTAICSVLVFLADPAGSAARGRRRRGRAGPAYENAVPARLRPPRLLHRRTRRRPRLPSPHPQQHPLPHLLPNPPTHRPPL